jgi:hypothetical protein
LLEKAITKPLVKKIVVVSPSFTNPIQSIAREFLCSDYALMAVDVPGTYIPANHEGIFRKGSEQGSKVRDVAYEDVVKGRKVAVVTLDTLHRNNFYGLWNESKDWEIIKVDEGISLSDLEEAVKRVRAYFSWVV